MVMTRERKADIIQNHGKSDTDTGGSEVQVALLTARIKDLTEHLRTHRKDNHSRRGLLMMVSRRTRILKYLRATDILGYRKLIEQLGIRAKE